MIANSRRFKPCPVCREPCSAVIEDGDREYPAHLRETEVANGEREEKGTIYTTCEGSNRAWGLA